MLLLFLFFFFKQKTAYVMRISDWSSDVCSSDLVAGSRHGTIVQSFAAVLDDRLGQRMVAQRFDGDGQRQQLAFIGAIDGHDIGDARTTFGQRPRLVESNRLERPEVFE